MVSPTRGLFGGTTFVNLENKLVRLSILCGIVATGKAPAKVNDFQRTSVQLSFDELSCATKVGGECHRSSGPSFCVLA